MHLAITGAGGFVGRAILEAMSQDILSCPIQELTLIGRGGQFWYPASLARRFLITEYKLDLGSAWSLPSGITHLLHLAADGSHDPYSEEAAHSFEQMTENLIVWAMKQKTLRSVIHTSSGACSSSRALVSGDSNDKVTTAGKERFVEGRLKAENLLTRHLGGSLSLRICRLYTFSGPLILLRQRYAVSNFVTTAVKDGKIRVRGNPHTVRTYLDQSDLGLWLLRLIEHNYGLSVPILEVGSESPVKIHELAEFISSETGARVIFEPTSEAAHVYIPNTAQTRESLHVTETMSWQDSVSRMIRLARTA